MGMFSNAVDMIRVKWQMRTAKVLLTSDQEDLRYCYEVLQDVSRSFAVVISQLNDPGLRDGICLFYLVLRALDTVEDDMSVPLDVKLRELPKFHTHMNDVEWSMKGIGKGRERELLENYPRVARASQQLKGEYRAVIEDICERMANGMCDFLQRPVVTKEDYNLYCHYVAGLVGHGLTRLFANCDFEDRRLADDLTDANHMGLFLQKTNIIRDYFEDILEEPPRMFWPKEIWGQYAEQLQDLKEEKNEKKAVECLNAMVADAVQHIPHVIDYLKPLRDPSVFSFCAIPQVMAIGTLAEVYNNPDTFHVKVKMSRGASCRVMVHSIDLYNALGMFAEYCDVILAKLDPNDASTPTIRKCLEESKQSIDALRKDQVPVPYMRSLMSRYPALGGKMLLSVLDSVSMFFSGEQAAAAH